MLVHYTRVNFYSNAKQQQSDSRVTRMSHSKLKFNLSYFPPLNAMTTKSRNLKGDTNSFWIRKGNNFNRKRDKENRFPLTEFLHQNTQKAEDTVLGPGGGAGFGCGVGVGFGLVGGFGYGGWPWNHLKMVFGVGMGCGVGLGIGFGQGIGYGFSLDSLQSYVSKQSSSDSNKSVVSWM